MEELREVILEAADAKSLILVLGGFFWCLFGIFLRKLHTASKQGSTVMEAVAKISKKEMLLKIMVVLASMRFFKVIFDTDQIAFAGFIIGLSLDTLPGIILAIPQYFTSKFNHIIKRKVKPD